jgi:hypothetical protein
MAKDGVSSCQSLAPLGQAQRGRGTRLRVVQVKERWWHAAVRLQDSFTGRTQRVPGRQGSRTDVGNAPSLTRLVHQTGKRAGVHPCDPVCSYQVSRIDYGHRHPQT